MSTTPGLQDDAHVGFMSMIGSILSGATRLALARSMHARPVIRHPSPDRHSAELQAAMRRLHCRALRVLYQADSEVIRDIVRRVAADGLPVAHKANSTNEGSQRLAALAA